MHFLVTYYTNSGTAVQELVMASSKKRARDYILKKYPYGAVISKVVKKPN